MSSTKKGKNYCFGTEIHIGVNAESGLMYTLGITTAKVAGSALIEVQLHGEEKMALGDSAQSHKNRNLAAERGEGEPLWAFPFKRQKGEALSEEEVEANRWLALSWEVVEHPFRLVKRQFGHTRCVIEGSSRMGNNCSCCSPWAVFTSRGRPCWQFRIDPSPAIPEKSEVRGIKGIEGRPFGERKSALFACNPGQHLNTEQKTTCSEPP
jgi:hypothetical protein